MPQSKSQAWEAKVTAGDRERARRWLIANEHARCQSSIVALEEQLAEQFASVRAEGFAAGREMECVK